MASGGTLSGALVFLCREQRNSQGAGALQPPLGRVGWVWGNGSLDDFYAD